MTEPNTMSAASGVPFPFTRLPAELRCMIYDLMPTFSADAHDATQTSTSTILSFNHAAKAAPYGPLQQASKGLLLSNRQLHNEFIKTYYKSASFAFAQPTSVRKSADRVSYFEEIGRHITCHAPAFSHVRHVRFEVNWCAFSREDMLDSFVIGAIRALFEAWSVYPAQSRTLEMVFRDERKGQIWDLLTTLEEGFSIEELNNKLGQLKEDMQLLPQVANLKVSTEYVSNFGTRNMSGYVLQDYAPCFEPLDVDNKKQETVNGIVGRFVQALVTGSN